MERGCSGLTDARAVLGWCTGKGWEREPQRAVRFERALSGSSRSRVVEGFVSNRSAIRRETRTETLDGIKSATTSSSLSPLERSLRFSSSACLFVTTTTIRQSLGTWRTPGPSSVGRSRSSNQKKRRPLALHYDLPSSVYYSSYQVPTNRPTGASVDAAQPNGPDLSLAVTTTLTYSFARTIDRASIATHVFVSSSPTRAIWLHHLRTCYLNQLRTNVADRRATRIADCQEQFAKDDAA